MKGDRYGNVVKIVKGRKSTLKTLGEDAYHREKVAHVLLDESNKVVRVILADCETL
jgi:hypothetical protein